MTLFDSRWLRCWQKKVVWVLWIMSEKTRSLVTPVVCPGGTDVPFLRHGKSAFYCCWIFLGSSSCIPCFSPMIYTPILLQEHNEFINGKILFRGIHIFVFVDIFFGLWMSNFINWFESMAISSMSYHQNVRLVSSKGLKAFQLIWII